MRMIAVLFLIHGLIFIVHAQEIKDPSLFIRGLQLMDAATTEAQYVESAAYFRNIVGENDMPWLAHYYAGLAYALASHENNTDKTKDALIDDAQVDVDKALEMNAGEPEILILQAFVFQARIQVNPELRG